MAYLGLSGLPHKDKLVQIEQQPRQTAQTVRIILKVLECSLQLRSRRRTGQCRAVAKIDGSFQILVGELPEPIGESRAGDVDHLAVHQEKGLRRGDRVGSQRTGRSAIVRVEGAQERWYDLAVV